MTKSQHQTGMTARIRDFFAANPDEELTIEDIRAKFGCTDGAVRMALVRNPHLEYARVVRLKSKGIAA